jgi:hypothetical protein
MDAPSCGVTLTVCVEHSCEISETALELRAFVLVQRVMLERLQQRSCG